MIGSLLYVHGNSNMIGGIETFLYDAFFHQGAEFLVLKGAERTIKRYLPIIYLEICPQWTTNFGYSPLDSIEWLEAFKYDTFLPCGSNNRKIGKFTFASDA